MIQPQPKMAAEPHAKKQKCSSGRLSGKKIFMTAAAQGIGRASAIVSRLIGVRQKRGHSLTVIATDVNGEKLSELNDVEGVITEVLDVLDKTAIEAILKKYTDIDVVFNCAGWVLEGTILDCDDDSWDFSFNLNVKSMFHVCKAVLPQMIARKSGSIINMSSASSTLKGTPKRCVYSATKAAVIGLTKGIAADFVDKGIRCNCICPGTIDTPSLKDSIAACEDPEKAYQAFVDRQAMGRLGTPEEVASIVVFLASDESSFVTGTHVVVDGGWTL